MGDGFYFCFSGGKRIPALSVTSGTRASKHGDCHALAIGRIISPVSAACGKGGVREVPGHWPVWFVLILSISLEAETSSGKDKVGILPSAPSFCNAAGHQERGDFRCAHEAKALWR